MGVVVAVEVDVRGSTFTAVNPLQVAFFAVLHEYATGIKGHRLFRDVVGVIGTHGGVGFGLDDFGVNVFHHHGRSANQFGHLEEVNVCLVVSPVEIEHIANLDTEFVDLLSGLNGFASVLGHLDTLQGVFDGFSGFLGGSVAIPNLFDGVPPEPEGFQGFTDSLGGLAVKGDFDAVKSIIGG